jgi:L-iditol 2-dehydrogenase
MILGHEFAGVVEVPAPDSARFKAGDPVAVLPLIPCGTCAGCQMGEPFHCANYQFLGSRNDGGFAEYCLVPEENLFLLPSGLDLRHAAFIEPMSVALHVVRQSAFTAGQSALVFGAGAIGLLVGLWLKVFGASRVVMADLRNESLALCRALGFTEAVNPSALDPREKFDSLFEAAGSSRALLSAIELAREKGRITVVGRDTADTVLPHASFERLMRKELSLQGCWGYNLNEDRPFLYDVLARGVIPAGKLVSHEVDLEQAPQTIAAMIEKKFYYCKVLIRCTI